MELKMKDYILFFLSVIIIGAAITLITNAGMGATAITSLPFVISEIWGISFGFMTALFNLLWVLLQIMIQRKNFPKIQLLQFIVSFLLGLSVDVSNLILGGINPQTYINQIIILVIGCLTMAFGIFLQLKANVVYNPAEGIVTVIAEHTRYQFSTIKTIFDSTLVILSILLGLFVTGKVTGIREGTIISALIIGPFTGMYRKLFNWAEEQTNETGTV